MPDDFDSFFGGPTADSLRPDPLRYTSADVEQMYRDEAARQGIDDTDTMLRHFRVQSTGEPDRPINPYVGNSSRGAIGPSQLMPATAAQLRVDPYDLAQNVRGGVSYYKQQLDRYGGDPIRAVAAYKAGPAAVDLYDGVPPYPETQNHIRKV